MTRAPAWAEADGYVGHGLTELPRVGRAARRWEPEPLRWLGASSPYTVYRFADRQEDRSASGATSVYARAANLIAGR